MAILGGAAACTPAAPTGATRAGGAGAAGARIYEGNCIPCHQENGRGIPGVFPSLAGSPVVLGDPKVLTRWVVMGQRPASMPAGRYAAAMPTFGWMRAPDAAALPTYVRTSFSNSAPAVEASTVSAALGGVAP